MAITYPLTLPLRPVFRRVSMRPNTVVGVARSPFTGGTQTSVWPGQWWIMQAELPPIKTLDYADQWSTFKLLCNGQQGTFYLGDITRRTSRGNPSGTWQVGAGNTANVSTLILQTGSGAFVVGDYLQIGTGATSKLHRITQKNSQYSYEVWPFLRSAYAAGTAVNYASPLGVFRLPDNGMDWDIDVAKFHTVPFAAIEAL